MCELVAGGRCYLTLTLCSFSRQMLQHMVDTMCPLLGTKMCGEELEE